MNPVRVQSSALKYPFMHKMISLLCRAMCAFIGWMLPALTLQAQQAPAWSVFPALPDPEGMAGMFAGESGGRLFCMGGANFPDKKPWEGGTKVWYDVIFRLREDGTWERMSQALPARMAYGVSAAYGDELILVGGSNERVFLADVWAMRWTQGQLTFRKLPSLPFPLANMAGCRAGKLLIVAGGNESLTGPPLSKCLALDLENIEKGWIELPGWPGPARTQPVAGTHAGDFFLFSGEGIARDSAGINLRTLYRDVYRLRTRKVEGSWTGQWERLSDLPGSVSASANPVPVDRKGRFYCWGGVSENISRHRDPATHPGIERKLIIYPASGSGIRQLATPPDLRSRVTLPSVHWKGQWIFISGEVRPGVRTPSNVVMKPGSGRR